MPFLCRALSLPRQVTTLVGAIGKRALEPVEQRQQFVDPAGADTARDLAMDIKRLGEESKFTRVAPGRYTLRELALEPMSLSQSPQGSTLPVAENNHQLSASALSAS